MAPSIDSFLRKNRAARSSDPFYLPMFCFGQPFLCAFCDFQVFTRNRHGKYRPAAPPVKRTSRRNRHNRSFLAALC
jgi:hypothetical protein